MSQDTTIDWYQLQPLVDPSVLCHVPTGMAVYSTCTALLHSLQTEQQELSDALIQCFQPARHLSHKFFQFLWPPQQWVWL